MMQSVDVAIVGGGMVGLALAAALKESELRIAIIESHTVDSALGEIPDIRVSALNRASETLLRRLGAWPGIEARRAAPFMAMDVWERDSFAHIDFDALSLNQPNLGHIVENRVIQLALLDLVSQQENVTLFMPQRCQSLAIGEREAWLSLDNGQVVTAKLVVGADGANSWVRQTQSIPLTHWDYGHHALVATVQTQMAHQQVARQTFTPDGPLAFLPLSDANQCSIVWSIDPTDAHALLTMPDVAFNKALSAAFDMRLGLCEVVSERQTVPLKMRYARDFVRERVALVGDAAHTIHPLAGQGVNLGLMDAASLAQEVIALWNAGHDIGSQRHLRGYERWRKAEAMKLIASMQAFRDLFDGDNPVKKLARGLGMTFSNVVPGLKEEAMRHALGLKGELPSLAKVD
ncbi:FAD-dependent 2-octaprenylphenol hydroxylase [Vibrio sp. SM6]|uniref:FAD-dependent 2-octaprenylphenol hydroxylase n=1 Tax=Vibrio agarilyticus TaxID=2726741 RepID=A0A7X8TQG1_9VIBR|nr:FAD-dependent 2-octaprenylphenol hydroxylase [Vibrio agarilyticus]NLS12854.1 FAD-dependent 2-octaprenylphenol hydroxylase [Vibrio agarilyticus]